jgi:hypothetical protein
MCIIVFRTQVWQTPDGIYYYARALRFTGLSEAAAYAEVARVGDALGYHYDNPEMMFHFDLVVPRLVHPLLAAPWVAWFGHAGMLVPTITGTAVFFGGTAWALAARYGRAIALGTSLIAMAGWHWFFFSVVTQPEGLAALWFAGALFAAVRYRRARRATAGAPSADAAQAAGKAASAAAALADQPPAAGLPGLAGGAGAGGRNRERGWWWLVVAGAFMLAFGFTRQAQLIPAGALFVVWLGEWVRSRRMRNSWLVPAAVIVGVNAASQLFQLLMFSGFSQRDQFLKETGTDNTADAIRVIPRLARRIFTQDFNWFAASDAVMLVFCLLVGIGLVACWRRVEAHLCLGAIAGALIYNISNGNPTALRYFQPGWICAVLLAAAVLAYASGTQPGSGLPHLPQRARRAPSRAASAEVEA